MVSVCLLGLCLCLGAMLGVNGTVFNNFDQCKQFFFKGQQVSGMNNVALPTPAEPPVITKRDENSRDPAKDPLCLSAYGASSPAYICQNYMNNYYFATLYDRARRIPLYSAYKMDLTGTPHRTGTVTNYEPQLVHPGLPQADQQLLPSVLAGLGRYNSINKCPQRVLEYRQTYKLAWSQAMDGDYEGYDRGHLNPAGHHRAGDGSKATMTFTNVAPQNQNMNTVGWNDYEERMRAVLSQDCKEVYVVTGVVPGLGDSNWLMRDGKRRVKIPTHYWNAYCCTDNNDKPLRSGGGLCRNTANVVPDEYTNVRDLENVLKGLLGAQQLQIFDNCVSQVAGPSGRA